MTTVCIFSHQDLSTNSGRHVRAVAEGLSRRGFRIIAVFPDSNLNQHLLAREDASIRILGQSEFFSHRTLAGTVDLYYFWSPRNKMSRAYSRVCNLIRKCPPYLVHLEDNDMLILMDALNLTPAQLVSYSFSDKYDPMISSDEYCCPRLASRFLDNALGITSLSKKLLEGLSRYTDILHFWPGFDCNNTYDHSVALSRIRKKFSIVSNSPIIAYTGNVHPSNVAEVRSLYISVALANRMGTPVTLVRTGSDYAQLFAESENINSSNNILNLGVIDLKDVFMLQAASKILVQPGLNDEWNQCRVPSKLPEYFASLRPVILPNANVGQLLTDGYNAIVLQEANACNIAKALVSYLPRRKDLDQIGLRGHLFARKYLTWEIASAKIAAFIHEVILKKVPASNLSASLYFNENPS